MSIDDLYEYFKQLKCGDDILNVDDFVIPECNYEFTNDNLNGSITEDEMCAAVENLKMQRRRGTIW